MNIVNPFAYFDHFIGMTPYQKIEKIGRLCYKSEDKITPDSAPKFVAALVKRGHEAMIEHHNFVLHIDGATYERILKLNPHFVNMTRQDGRYIISGSARSFKDLWKETGSIDVFFICDYLNHQGFEILFGGMPFTADNSAKVGYIKLLSDEEVARLSYPEQRKHRYLTAHFLCDRGVTHEIVRHRPASFAQESTRYCNYSKGKHGSEITLIKPFFFKEGSTPYWVWRIGCKVAEWAYMWLVNHGRSPQEARSVLPNSLKTELYMTANIQEWLHFLSLRATNEAHPQMKEVAVLLKDQLDDLVTSNY